MNGKLLEWLNNQVNPFSDHPGKLGQIFKLLVLIVVSVFLLWRLLLYREVHQQFAQLKAAHYPASGTAKF